MAVAPPPSPIDEESASDLRAARHAFFALIRDVRADVQDLERSLIDLEQLASVQGGKVAANALQAAVAEAEPVFARVQNGVETRLRAVREELFARHPVLWDESGDEVTHIDNLWNRVIGEWPARDASPEEIVRRIAASRALVKQILFHSGRLTIPDRLNRHLAFVRVGKALNFDEAFSDEVPDAADRLLLLRYLADHPTTVEGIVDVARGLVFRVSPSLRVRIATYLAPLVAVFAGAGVVALAGVLDDWLDVTDWPTSMRESGPLLTGYFFVVLGAVVHVAVDTLKQQRFGAGTSFLALDDVLAWVHVRYFSICASVLWVLVGIFGLAATSDKLTWDLAFFVGFSLDSLGGLFLQRFGQVVDRRTKLLTGELTGTV
jgi:hypothetical protein